MSLFLPAVRIAHLVVEETLHPDELAVDATAGNGHDTCFLARVVGEGGRVLAIDLQAAAIERTRARLAREGYLSRLQLIHGSHAGLANHLPPDARGRVGAVMFNLGYLPNADHSVKTAPESTIAAIGQAVEVLRDGGVVTVVLYTGHEGGAEEASAVEAFAAALDQDQFIVVCWSAINQKNDPPYVIAIRRR